MFFIQLWWLAWNRLTETEEEEQRAGCAMKAETLWSHDTHLQSCEDAIQRQNGLNDGNERREVVCGAPHVCHDDTIHPKEKPNTSWCPRGWRNVELRPPHFVGIKAYWCSTVMGQCAYQEEKKHREHTSMDLTWLNVSLPTAVSLLYAQFFTFNIFSFKMSRTDIKAHNRKQLFDRSG